MKKLLTILTAVLLSATIWAQSPQKMSYQAVIRNAGNNLVASTAVGMQISILQSSVSGTVVYTETQTPGTNANGLVSIEIGAGTVVSGDFTTIDWANGPYFIKTETDPTGGDSYTITGISQLLSVPYALHAKTAESITGTITETDPVFTAWDKDYSDLTNTPNTITSAQASAITANTAKVGYTEDLVSANADVVANKAKVGITTEQADAIVANTVKVGITPAQASEITANTAKVGYTDALVSANTDVAANTAKVGITAAQANAIIANTAKVGYTDALVSANTAVALNTAKVGITAAQANAITENTAKVGYTEALVSANTDVTANTAKVGITAAQATAITANTAKVGINPAQASAITANTAKVGYTDALVSANTAVAANTAKVGITSTQATAITANTAKNSYPTADATKLSGIAAGAEVNVQSDWNQTTTTADDFIKNKPYIAALTTGQSYQGGIIFWLDATGQHGLIAATADQGTGIRWHNGTYRYTGTTGDGLYAGSMNTAMIIAAQITNNQTQSFAAKLCADYSVKVDGVTYGDWYLPSKYELNLLYLQKTAVGGFASAAYWSSTEYDMNFAWGQTCGSGYQFNGDKYDAYYVRAVRAF